MKRLILIIIFSTQNLWASQMGLGLGIGKVDGEDIQSIAFDYSIKVHQLNLFSLPLNIGLGLRYTNLTSDTFKINSKGNETLTDLSSQSYNIAVYSDYELSFMSLGFNIDLLGYTHGRQTSISSSATKVRPEQFNLLLGGEADLGTLNSEFWVGKKFQSFTFKLGMSHLVTEYDDKNITLGKRQKFFDTYFLNIAYNWM
ncbi:MAG: hypothetical protein JNM93_04605 [Bacteriovoracaceae bacterium]|nr:hypothetical protein [Bacteriovoracaceae bacterium]